MMFMILLQRCLTSHPHNFEMWNANHLIPIRYMSTEMDWHILIRICRSRHSKCLTNTACNANTTTTCIFLLIHQGVISCTNVDCWSPTGVHTIDLGEYTRSQLDLFD